MTPFLLPPPSSPPANLYTQQESQITNKNWLLQENTSVENTETFESEATQPLTIQTSQERGRKREQVVLKGQMIGQEIDLEKTSERLDQRTASEEAKMRKHLPGKERTLTPVKRVTQQGVSVMMHALFTNIVHLTFDTTFLFPPKSMLPQINGTFKQAKKCCNWDFLSKTEYILTTTTFVCILQ